MRTFINGLDINYKIIGEGRPLLILHGWGSESGKWQRVGELLAEKGIRAIIPDLPGFGESEKPKKAWNLDDYCDFIQEFINKLGLLNKFYLLGHSFGGAIAVKCSLKFPEKIEKLFLVGATCVRRKSFKVKFLKIISKIFKIKPLFFRKLFYRKSDYLSVQGIMKEIYFKIIAEDITNILSQVQVPTVIIWGEKDNITPIKDAYLIKEKIQNSRLRQARLPARQGFGGQAKLEIIPGANHDLNSKAPEKLFGAVIKYL